MDNPFENEEKMKDTTPATDIPHVEDELEKTQVIHNIGILIPGMPNDPFVIETAKLNDLMAGRNLSDIPLNDDFYKQLEVVRKLQAK